MAKLRVHELAKELGTTSKELLVILRDKGEFVKSASSTIEAPVARRMREHFAQLAASQPKKPEPEKKATTKKTSQAPAKTRNKSQGASRSSAVKASAGHVSPQPAKGKKTGAGHQAEGNESVSQRPQSFSSHAPAPKSQLHTGVHPGIAPSSPTRPHSPSQKAPSAPAAHPTPGVSVPHPLPHSPAQSSSRTSHPHFSDTTVHAKPGEKAPHPHLPRQRGNNDGVDSRVPMKPGQRAPRPHSPRHPGMNARPYPTPAAMHSDTSHRSSQVPKPRGPRPGNNPFASAQGMPRPQVPKPRGPRPGNNPFASAQGMPRPGEKAGRHPHQRPGAPRPMHPDRSQGQRRHDRHADSAPHTHHSRVDIPEMTQNVPGTPGAPSRRGGFAGRGGRGIGRGSTQGAFGRGAGSRSKKRKSKRAKRQEFEQQSAPVIGGVQVPRGDGTTEIRLRTGASLSDFADKINCNPAGLITVLMQLGEMATANQSLDEDTLATVGDELGYVVKVVSPEDEDRELLESFDIDLEAEEVEDEGSLKPRPPVVTVMGHVDHGKTKLLDAIRHTDVVAAEHGGITQHIGAYQVKVTMDGEERRITFIDTPGHEAFTAMRARGAEVTDIAVLVVAADDGVMPQTVEAINHAQAAHVPIVVAVNKIDKEGADPMKVRSQLTEYGVIAEEFGGDTLFVDVSAKKQQGITDVLEAILLTADAELELSANPHALARGTAIEARLDKGRGAVVTALVQRGTLRVGDPIVVGSAHGRVRAMFDEYGKNVKEAGPSRPVQVLGLTSVPRAGDSFIVAEDDRTARQIADKREAVERQAELGKRRKRISLEDFNKALEEGKVETLNLIIKGDVSGAVEALEDSLLKIDVGDEVDLRIIHRGVGAITQNDINLATVDKAVIIGFNVRPAERVVEYAEREGVDMHFYSVIYQAIEDVEKAMKGMLKPIYEEVEMGKAEILQIFRSSKFGNIAGCHVRKGVIKRGTSARLVRNGVVVTNELEITSLRREKDDVNEVREGYECGIGLGFKDIAVGDVIETWTMEEKARD